MKIKCGINGEEMYENQISLCHHCGMPVCEEHGWVVAVDDAFADAAPARPATSTATAARPAMHCRDCLEKFHRAAVKRHGWTDPGPATAGFGGSAGRR